MNHESVPGSGTDSMKNLTEMSNVNIPGKFVFRVDQAKTGTANTVNVLPTVDGNVSGSSNHNLRWILTTRNFSVEIM